MTRDCDRDDIEELLDELREQMDWRLTDWEFGDGMFDRSKLTVTVQWEPHIPDEASAAAVGSIIDRLDDGDGADRERVKEETGHPQAAEEVLSRLRSQGEIYEPSDGKVRRT